MEVLCLLALEKVGNKKELHVFKVYQDKKRGAQLPFLFKNVLTRHFLLSDLLSLQTNYNFYHIQLCAFHKKARLVLKTLGRIYIIQKY